MIQNYVLIPSGRMRLGFSRNIPLRIVVFIPMIVGWNNIHHENILRLGVQTRHGYFKRRKHSSL